MRLPYQVITKTDPLGNYARMAYDAVGRVTSATDPSGNTSTMAYDDHGNVTTATDPLSKTVTYWLRYRM